MYQLLYYENKQIATLPICSTNTLSIKMFPNLHRNNFIYLLNLHQN